MRQSDLTEMEKLQAKLIKTSLGLSKYMQTTPLLNALHINKLQTLRDVYSMDLMKYMMLSNTGAKELYYHLINKSYIKGKYENLISRVSSVCSGNDIQFLKYIFNDSYSRMCRRELKKFPSNDGLADSCRVLLKNYNFCDKEMLKLLLSPF